MVLPASASWSRSCRCIWLGAGLPDSVSIRRFPITPRMRRKEWRRELLRILKAYDREQLSAHVVADHFAALNHEVYRNLVCGTVGPRCIVAWRNGRDG